MLVDFAGGPSLGVDPLGCMSSQWLRECGWVASLLSIKEQSREVLAAITISSHWVNL